jgi:hypothetical protein
MASDDKTLEEIKDQERQVKQIVTITTLFKKLEK